MLLSELFKVIPDVVRIRVFDQYTDECIATYDGRDSIPAYLNTFDVLQVIPVGHYDLDVIVL